MSNNSLLRLSKSCIGEEEIKAVSLVLENEFLGMGKEVQIFETELSTYFQRDSICVVNGTAALHLALQACDIGVGDEVLLPSLTYVASFQAISATGAIPIACDVDLNSGLLSIDDVLNKLSSKTKAIMPVHYCGGIANLESIYNVANKYKLRVIEDAAHSFGSEYKGQKIGSFGDIVCFSFDGIKNITSGEGGCIVTSDQIVLNKIKDIRLLGVEKDTEKRFSGGRSWDFDVKYQGWRYHMSNIMASIGLEQFKKKEIFFQKRRELAKYYDRLLLGNSNITFFERDYNEIVPHIYVIKINNSKNRDYIQKVLMEKNIQTGIHYYPNHLLSFFKDSNKSSLPNTELLYSQILTLPLHPDLKFSDLEYIVNELDRAIKL